MEQALIKRRCVVGTGMQRRRSGVGRGRHLSARSRAGNLILQKSCAKRLFIHLCGLTYMLCIKMQRELELATTYCYIAEYIHR